MTQQDVRWKQRFQNFSAILKLLHNVATRAPESLSNLEKEGGIKRFEMTFELAWNLLKDRLEYLGHIVSGSPREVIKLSFKVGLISDGEGWLDMLEIRRNSAHRVDEAYFVEAFAEVRSKCVGLFTELQNSLADEAK